MRIQRKLQYSRRPLLPLCGAPAFADAVADAKKIVRAGERAQRALERPDHGTQGGAGKTIIYVSTDQRNGGARVPAKASRRRGEDRLDFRPATGRGRLRPRERHGQAIASKPDVIVLGGIDATEQATVIQEAAKQGIVILGWHSYAKSGPHDTLPIFTNITTDPLEVPRRRHPTPARRPRARSAR